MKTYIGVKEVKAEPLNLGDYNKFKGWDIPTNEDPLREGYKVIYSDDYISWSPKEVFEESYKEVRLPENIKKPTSPVEDRLKMETLELENKIYKLRYFIDANSTFLILSDIEQKRLKQQLLAMKYYLTILVERLENFQNLC